MEREDGGLRFWVTFMLLPSAYSCGDLKDLGQETLVKSTGFGGGVRDAGRHCPSHRPLSSCQGECPTPGPGAVIAQAAVTKRGP